jgi:catechol 2,3-dioxygenase-like lactoylglutathione lyase family enzyme
MQLKRLDHVNIRTANLAAMMDWYRDILGMESGPRPDFKFGGAWMYLDGFPIVHLVEVAKPATGADPRLEHFAISGVGLADFLAHLRRHKVAYKCGVAPGEGFGISQINIWDPDGNHVHVDFGATEKADLTDYDGS